MYILNNKYIVVSINIHIYQICINMYTRSLKYSHLKPIFRQNNEYLVSSTYQHKYKWILCTEKTVLNASFQDFWCTSINNHLFCFEKNENYVLKIPYMRHEFLALNTYLSSFSKKKQMLKYTIFYWSCWSHFIFGL